MRRTCGCFCGGGAGVIHQLVLDGLEVLLVKLRQVHEHQLIVMLVQEQHLNVLLLHRLKVWRRLRQLPTDKICTLLNKSDQIFIDCVVRI